MKTAREIDREALERRRSEEYHQEERETTCDRNDREEQQDERQSLNADTRDRVVVMWRAEFPVRKIREDCLSKCQESCCTFC